MGFYLIQNGCVTDPESGREEVADVLVEGNRITKIGKNLRENLKNKDWDQIRVFDANGFVVAPGLVDVHAHFRDPGFTHKEDVESGAKAAARGGYTTVVLMANTKPNVDTPEVLKEILKKGEHTKIHVHSCANVSVGMKGQELTDMEALVRAGAIGFTDDGIPLTDSGLVYLAMEKASACNKPISFHEEDPALIENNGINRGEASAYYKVGGSPREAESRLVKRDLEIAAKTEAQIVIQHVSAKETVELLRHAKKTNPRIHAEATPHHFTLTEKAVIQYGSNAKMNPPLRKEADRQAILEGIKDGTLDLIATDHAPHAKEEKEKPITEAPSGIIGLETALSLGIDQLVNEGWLSMGELLHRMSTAPAKLYGLDAGYLAEKGVADIVVFDPHERTKYDSFYSKSSNTPFRGWDLPGKVYLTIAGGEIAYEDEAWLCQKKEGENCDGYEK